MLIDIENEPVNREVQMIKSDLDDKYNQKLSQDITPKTETGKKDTSTNSKELPRPIKTSQATYFYDKCLMLASSCDILAEDIILINKINVKTDETESSTNIDISNIIESIEDSHIDLWFACGDESLNGSCCLKIEFFEETDKFRLVQLPQETLEIIKITDKKLQEDPIYLVEQKIGNDKKYYKIFDETYPENYKYDDKELDFVAWKGGDKFYNFFSKPFWLQCIESMNSQIALESLDTDKINNGFKMNNVLFFNKKPSYLFPTPTNVLDQNPVNNDSENQENNTYFTQLAKIAENVNAQKIATELRAAGNGTAILYEETMEPMTMQTATLSDTNYTYLLEKSKQADQKIMSRSGIPRERYMINDVTESMNSQKTAKFWEIYTKSLTGKQRPYERWLEDIIYFVYPDLFHGIIIDIEVPMFSELINAKIDKYSGLFLKGLLTLGQTITFLVPYITNLNLDDLDLTNPIYNMRFFNGNPIGDYSLNPDDMIEYNKATSFME
jgi:hypothetical protein